MRRTGLIAAAALVLSAWAQDARAEDAPLQVYGNLQTIELAPVLLAAEAFSPIPVEVKMGGIANLVGEAGAQGFASPGVADLATNAETQLLRFSVRHPDLRIIFNVTEGLYRIVARRSSGIATSEPRLLFRDAECHECAVLLESRAIMPNRYSTALCGIAWLQLWQAWSKCNHTEVAVQPPLCHLPFRIGWAAARERRACVSLSRYRGGAVQG